MKSKTNFSVLIIILLSSIFNACHEGKGVDFNVQAPDYTDNYNYYPTIDGNLWYYDYTFVDSVNKQTVKYNEIARYSGDSAINITYRNGAFWSYKTWSNSSNYLRCCGNRILINYNYLNCNSDSMLIYAEKFNGHDSISILQYCGNQFALQSPNYSSVKCIKTFQKYIYATGNTLFVNSYFGYKIGLIYQESNK
jgi:hypothetical protein